MVRAGIGPLALAISLTLACGDDDGTRADAGDGDGDAGIGEVDAADGVSALEVAWRLVPDVNGVPTGPLSLVITDARFSLEELRAVGDADVLQRGSFELDFRDEIDPLLRFAPAAPGLYSSFVGRFKSYTVRGTIELEGETWEFEIRDEPPSWVTFSIPLEGVEVLPGRTEHVQLRIDVGEVLEAIDWSGVEVDDGALEIDRESDEIASVRGDLADAFGVE